MSLDAGLIARVKEAAQADLPQLAEAAGYRPTRVERRYHCASCSDKNPSAWLYEHHIHSFCCQQTHDAIDLEQRAGGGQASDAIRRLAVRYGLPTQERALLPRPRYSSEQIAEAEQFRVAFISHVEAKLAESKRQMWDAFDAALPLRDGAPSYSRGVFELTQFVAEVQTWTPYQAVQALRDLRQSEPALTADLLTDAEFFQSLVAKFVCGLAQERAA